VKKLLIPSKEPGGLDAEVYPHWRGAPTFTEVILDGERVAGVKVHRLGSDELLIDLVRKEGIGFVIAQSLSTRALELLERVGVKVLRTRARVVRDTVKEFVAGKLCVLKLSCVPMDRDC